MLSEKEREEARLWYIQNRAIYEKLCCKVADILKENLLQAEIPYANIQNRAKDIDKFVEKIKRPNIPFKPQEMQDLAGIRIICYISSDAEKISKLITQLFDIDSSLSLDKSQLLGSDKVGYKSIHFIAKFPRERTNLKEYTQFDNLCFEIQVRTILQHAWAEIEHDKSYKFSGILPHNIKRKMFLISGLLEVADNEFDAASKLLEEYSKEVSNRTKYGGNLEIPIDSASLRQYLSDRFTDIPQIERKFGPEDDMSELIVRECFDMGLKTLADLDALIPKDFKERFIKYKDQSNFCGVIRLIFIISNAKIYFTKAWRHQWSFMGPREDYEIYNSYGISLDQLSKEYGVKVESV